MSKTINKYDKDAAWTVKYRRERLENEFSRIRRMMDGYDKSVYAYIEDGNGMIDPDKVDNMIDGMLDALDKYLEISGFAPVDNDQKEWYRCYLYCVITSPDIDTQWLIPEYIESRSFGDIFEFANIDPKLQDIEEFIWNENHEWSSEDDTQWDILFFLKHSYCSLTGKDISEIYNEEQKIIYEKLEPVFPLSVENREPGKPIGLLAQMNNTETETNSPIAEGRESEKTVSYQDEDYADLEKDEGNGSNIPDDVRAARMQENMEEEEREYAEKVSSVSRWCTHIGDAKRYEEEYLRFRRLFLNADLTRMADDMKYLTDAYLYEQGLNAYSLQDNYGLIDDAIKGTSGWIRREILRARALS